MDCIITTATDADREVLADIFMAHITAHREYISHGEMQMGTAVMVTAEDGSRSPAPAPDGRRMWIKYITEKISSEDAVVYKAVSGEEIVGFCVADIEEDGADPFGMLCDVLVKENVRGGGIGSALMAAGLGWLRSKGITDIYLESGKNNHSAHGFFERRGFRKVSEIFRLDNQD